MRKTLSLLLSGTMTIGLALQTSAAPLARWTPGRGAPPTQTTRTIASGDHKEMQLSGISRKLRTPGSQKFTTITSPSLAKKHKALRSATTASRVSSNLGVYGNVIYDNTWTDYTRSGIYSIPVTQAGEFAMMATSANPDVRYGAYDGENTYYCMTAVGMSGWIFGVDIYVYDTETWTVTKIIEADTDLLGTEADIDPVTGKMYGCFTDSETYRYWGSVDLSEPVPSLTPIANLAVGLRGVAFDDQGQAYGIDMAGVLYTIEKETGAMEEVGQTGLPALKYLSAASYNAKDKTIVVSYCNDESTGLYEVDPATAASTPIREFENEQEVVGLFIPFMPADKAPDTPGLEVTCVDGAQDVSFKITLPATLADGTDATGSMMHYDIYANGETVSSGDAEGGDVVEETKTIEATGMVDFYVVASNDAGVSKKAKATIYVGKGIPSKPSNVVLAYADGSFTLTWDAVTTAADNGYFDPAAVTYDVVDDTGETVDSGLTATSWTKDQPIPDTFTQFSYSVIAKHGGKASASVKSNAVNLGHYNAPMEMDLKSAGNFAIHTVLDANIDSKTWVFNNKEGAEYKYHNSNTADDWLFSPAIYLEAGKAYDFEAIARAYNDKYPEHLEIWLGTATTAEAMTIKLVEKTQLPGTLTTLAAPIVPSASGEYHIGFHAVSDPGQWSLFLSSYKISEPYGATAPDAVSGLVAVPDITGDLKVALNFKTSDKTVTGEAMNGDITVRVLRDGVQVTEQTGAHNASMSIEDRVEAAGRYTYTVESYNATGDKGRSASCTVFVGPNIPNPPATVKAIETVGKPGEVTLSWEHAADDVDGNPLLTDNLTYNVYVYDGKGEEAQWKKLTETPVSELSYTFQAQEADAPQAFIQVGVQTINRGVEGEYLQGAGLVAVGPAYAIPFRMSNIEDIQTYIVGIDSEEGCEWSMAQDGGQFSNVSSQDNDGSYFYGERVNSYGLRQGDLWLGKVDLADAGHPIISFYTWKVADNDINTVDVIILCEGEQTLLGNIDLADDVDGLWTKHTLDLQQFKGKSIQPILRYHSHQYVYLFLDNIQIREHYEHDLAAVSITAPEEVEASQEFEIKVDVKNEGRIGAGEFAVELIANGEVVATEPVESLGADDVTTVIFTQTINMAQAATILYTARVVYDSDMDPDNDTTLTGAEVKRAESKLPAVSVLSGEVTADGNHLTWDAITSADIPADPTTEDFESGLPFDKEFYGWTFVDVDGHAVGGFKNWSIPNHNPGVDPCAFIVLDSSDESLANDFKAYSGDMYIGSIYCMGEGDQVLPSDDWAISPLLNGSAQTVTFMCRNLSINYMEMIQVWYTTSDSTNPDDFVMLESFNDPNRDYKMLLVDKWKEFAFDLPEGALHFAFRVISDNGFMVMIDDVKYIPDGAPVTIEHLGYNIYCDGQRLNDTPLTTPEYIHNVDDDIDHVYHVTAVYNRGESEVSNAVTLKKSGIDAIGLTPATRVAVEGRDIVVCGAENLPVMIAAVDGKTIHAATGNARVAVLPGIYLVKVDRKVTKLIVK